LRFPGSQQFRWTFDFRGEAAAVLVEGPLDADDGDVLTQWALDGLGLVMKPLFEVAPFIVDGRLVEVLPEARPQPATLGVLYPTRRMLPPRTKSFIDLAVEESRRHVASQLALLEPTASRSQREAGAGDLLGLTAH
jgi:DNA-binding transcriptional LysR family regulator